jgi:pyridoxine 5-phosphate synthase
MGIRTSVFIDPVREMIEGAKSAGADRIELYTEAYAKEFYTDKTRAIRPFIEAASIANGIGLGINAGHDLNLDNLRFFYKSIPGLLEVSIGHALISDALYFGLEKTIQRYLQQLA